MQTAKVVKQMTGDLDGISMMQGESNDAIWRAFGGVDAFGASLVPRITAEVVALPNF
jgi:hypothetical protein